MASISPFFATDVDLKDIGVLVGHRRKMLRVISEPADSPSKPEPEPKSRESAGRPQLTVMFCDLVGSTALWTRRPEDLPAVISTSQRCCYPAVAKSGGFVASYMGADRHRHWLGR
jgi:class 3 adenylate cyclase